MIDPRPCCATCDAYQPAKEVAVDVASSGFVPQGFCNRYPQAVPKPPGAWCREWRSPAPDHVIQPRSA